MRRLSENPCRDWSAGNICARTFGPCRGSKGYRAGFARGYGVLSCVVGKPQRTQRTTPCHGASDAQIPCILGGQPRQTNLYVGIVPQFSAYPGVPCAIAFKNTSASPLNRYLTLRRMNFARRALQKADPAVTCVTDVATEFGFWELGRFAVAYKLAFGKSPSMTLRQNYDRFPVSREQESGVASQPSPAERHRSAVRPGDHLCTGRSLASTALNGFQDR